MAQAQGGTAGSSSTRGNGSLSAGGGRNSGSGNAGNTRGVGGSLASLGGNSGNSKGGATQSAAASSSPANAAPAATAAAVGDKKTGSIMSGLSDAMSSVRAARAPQGELSAADVAGIDSESHSAGENIAARDQGFRDTANAKTTAAVMGGLGSVGSVVGNLASKVASAAAPTEGSDLSANHNVGKAWANSVGPSKTTSMAASLAGGILGGPIGSALAGFALGIANDQAAKAANPQAMAATPQQIANRATFGQQAGTSSSDQYDATGASSDTSNSGSNMMASMSAAAQPGAGFQAAGDFSEQRKVDNLNLGSII